MHHPTSTGTPLGGKKLRFLMIFRNISAPQFLPSTVAAALAIATLNTGQANALVVYEFIQQGSDVVMNVSGSVSTTPSSPTQASSFGNIFNPFYTLISSGNFGNSGKAWNLNGGPTGGFGNFVQTSFTSYSGTAINLAYGSALFIDNYTLGTPISGFGLFAAQSLASLGFSSTAPGLIASWNIAGSTGETVEVRIGSNAPSSVPSPLPLVGAAAAFAHSRRLRARLRQGLPSPKP